LGAVVSTLFPERLTLYPIDSYRVATAIVLPIHIQAFTSTLVTLSFPSLGISCQHCGRNAASEELWSFDDQSGRGPFLRIRDLGGGIMLTTYTWTLPKYNARPSSLNCGSFPLQSYCFKGFDRIPLLRISHGYVPHRGDFLHAMPDFTGFPTRLYSQPATPLFLLACSRTQSILEGCFLG
jgi:hypothetical protein